jgi:hypothetical protein
LNEVSVYQRGVKAENYFISLMNKVGLKWDQMDTYYDFEVNGHKIEIKSCRVVCRNGNNERGQHDHKCGRFDFTDVQQRQDLVKNDCWVCFIISDFDQFILCGFRKAKHMDMTHRYYSLAQLREDKFNLLNLDDWINTINK